MSSGGIGTTIAWPQRYKGGSASLILIFMALLGSCTTERLASNLSSNNGSLSSATVQGDSRSPWLTAQDARALRQPGRWNDAATAYQSVLDNSIDTDGLRWEYAEVLSKAGRWEESAAQYRVIVDRPEQFVPSSPPNEALYRDTVTREEHVRRSWFCIAQLSIFRLQRYDEALFALDKREELESVKDDVFNFVQFEYRGRALEGLGRTKEAVASYRKVLEIAKKADLESERTEEIRERIRVLSQAGT